MPNFYGHFDYLNMEILFLTVDFKEPNSSGLYSTNARVLVSFL